MTAARVAGSTGKSESSRRKGPCGRPILYQVAITTSDRAASVRQRVRAESMGVDSERGRGVEQFAGLAQPGREGTAGVLVEPGGGGQDFQRQPLDGQRRERVGLAEFAVEAVGQAGERAALEVGRAFEQLGGWGGAAQPSRRQ